jgi:hypothetical protein
MIINAAGERSEQDRFLSKSPGSSNALLASAARIPVMAAGLGGPAYDVQ